MALPKYTACLEDFFDLYLCHVSGPGKASGQQKFDDGLAKYAFLNDKDSALKFKTGVECLNFATKILKYLDPDGNYSYMRHLVISRE